MNSLRISVFFVFSLFVTSGAVFADDAEKAVSESPSGEGSRETRESGKQDASAKILDRITVAATREEALATPGSVNVVRGEELELQLTGVDDIHRVLRQVPGVNIQEEDGYGLRPNIGFRGVPNERSAKITLMEDGVLIAPAPYAAPSAYYFPPVGRMEGVEVTKGSGQIKYGPYTTGGALNLLSSSIPDEKSVKAKVGVGNNNLRKIYAGGGNSWKYGGVFLETYQFETDGFKNLDGGGDTGVDLEDYQLKVRLNTDRDKDFYQQVEYKFGIYDQLSNETYLGLTEDDFGKTPNRRYAASARDRIDVDHIQHNLVHFAELGEGLDLTTNFYLNQTQRNWRKLEKVNGTGISSILASPSQFAEELSFLRGDVDSTDGVLAIRDNKRDYESKGIQSVLGAEFETAGAKHKLELGARYHADEEDRFQQEDAYSIQNGSLVLSERAAPGSQANRIGSANAWAFYMQDTVEVGKLTLIPGLRYERISYTREDFGKSDPTRSGSNLKRNDTNVEELIPGISLQYEFMPQFAGFVGVHKGFSPPGPTSKDGVDEEESISYELGSSYAAGTFNSKLTFFYNDYDNLLGADTLSSGGTGSGDLFNGGEVDVYGLEFSAGYDLLEGADSEIAVPVNLNYTFTNAEFQTDFDSDFFGDVSDGDDVPYIPEHQLQASVGVETEDYKLYFEGVFTDGMKTAAGEVGTPDRTDSAMVFDLVGKARVNDTFSLFATVENLFDREYVVARRPAGARPGLPLTAVIGFEVEL